MVRSALPEALKKSLTSRSPELGNSCLSSTSAARFSLRFAVLLLNCEKSRVLALGEGAARFMNRFSFVSAAGFFATLVGSALTLSGIVLAQTNGASEAAQSNRGERNESQVARGKYIVEGIAVCGQCHTPRNSQGELDHTRWLEGAPLWLQPSTPSANWPIAAPRLAGSPPGSDADLITLLTTGLWQNGQRLRPPMPVFHMSREDAEAVVAYLRSLSPPHSVR